MKFAYVYKSEHYNCRRMIIYKKINLGNMCTPLNYTLLFIHNPTNVSALKLKTSVCGSFCECKYMLTHLEMFCIAHSFMHLHICPSL
jgi:hypothetical protein